MDSGRYRTSDSRAPDGPGAYGHAKITFLCVCGDSPTRAFQRAISVRSKRGLRRLRLS